MGLMLIGLLCAVSFITLQTGKNKILKEKLNGTEAKKKVVSGRINSTKKPYVSELLR
jgi:hypothetical protein